MYAHIEMHRMDNFKITDAQEAKMVNNFKCSFKVCINSDCAFGWYTKWCMLKQSV